MWGGLDKNMTSIRLIHAIQLRSSRSRFWLPSEPGRRRRRSHQLGIANTSEAVMSTSTASPLASAAMTGASMAMAGSPKSTPTAASPPSHLLWRSLVSEIQSENG